MRYQRKIKKLKKDTGGNNKTREEGRLERKERKEENELNSYLFLTFLQYLARCHGKGKVTTEI
jgi:hypothetical protein